MIYFKVPHILNKHCDKKKKLQWILVQERKNGGYFLFIDLNSFSSIVQPLLFSSHYQLHVLLSTLLVEGALWSYCKSAYEFPEERKELLQNKGPTFINNHYSVFHTCCSHARTPVKTHYCCLRNNHTYYKNLHLHGGLSQNKL